MERELKNKSKLNPFGSMDRTNLIQSIGLDCLFATDQDAFDQRYLCGAIEARIDRPEKPSGTKYL